MSERFKELVLKTSDSAMSRGFESHSLRQLLILGMQEFNMVLRRSTQVVKRRPC